MAIEQFVKSCCDALPSGWKQRPWEHLNHGRAVLDSEDKLNAYIAAYGEMHIVKCRMAMKHFPFEDLVIKRNDRQEIIAVRNFEIYDWGCGQGIGTLVLLEMLNERGLIHALRRITLIEPSEKAISRAENLMRQCAHASTEIRKINRFIPDNDKPAWDNIGCQTSLAVHIFSNILDIREVGLKWLAQQSSRVAKDNIYICIGPRFGYGISRISDFHNYLGHPECFTDISNYPCAYTSDRRHPFGIEAKCFKFNSSSTLNAGYIEHSSQTPIDEYQSGDDCLYGIMPRPVISAYHKLQEAADKSSFELYLRPTIGIERPDFILANIDRGVLIVNVCDDITKFRDAFEKVSAIKEALIDTYIKSLKVDTIIKPSTYNTIKIGLYFPGRSPQEVQDACAKYYKPILERWEKAEAEREEKCKKEGTPFRKTEKPKDPTIFMVKLSDNNCSDILNSINCKGFRFDYYSEIQNLILGNWHKYSQGDLTLRLTKPQQKLVDDESCLLKIKGVAGCGKTQIVAHKAVKENIRTGSKVLIVTFNIALIQYIQMRINEVPADFSTDAFEIINYHQFFISKAKRYSGGTVPFGASSNPDFFEPFIKQIIANGDQYETIIVDEAQDYIPAWFECLKYFLAPNGRMIVCGDGRQNIYNRDTEESSKMPKISISGQHSSPWKSIGKNIQLRQLNYKISLLAAQLAKKFNLRGDDTYIQREFDDPQHHLAYWNIGSSASADKIAGNILWILNQYNLKRKDVVVLGQTINLLREVDGCIRTACNSNTMITFESKDDYEKIKDRTNSLSALTLKLKAIRRAAKVHFTTDTDLLKLATIQSFKGWESNSVILIIQNDTDGESEDNEFVLQTRQNIPAHLYTAITRARENLFILNLGNATYHNFFKDRIIND